jgi:hypothetical protein
MSRSVTITLTDDAYQRLQEQFGDDQIDRVIGNLLRPYIDTDAELDAGYAAMAADTEHEAEALEWIETRPDEGLEDDDEDWSWLQPH